MKVTQWQSDAIADLFYWQKRPLKLRDAPWINHRLRGIKLSVAGYSYHADTGLLVLKSLAEDGFFYNVTPDHIDDPDVDKILGKERDVKVKTYSKEQFDAIHRVLNGDKEAGKFVTGLLQEDLLFEFLTGDIGYDGSYSNVYAKLKIPDNYYHRCPIEDIIDPRIQEILNPKPAPPSTVENTGWGVLIGGAVLATGVGALVKHLRTRSKARAGKKQVHERVKKEQEVFIKV